jgi:hypothetical protein
MRPMEVNRRRVRRGWLLVSGRQPEAEVVQPGGDVVGKALQDAGHGDGVAAADGEDSAVAAPSTQTADPGGSAVSCDFSWGDRGDLNPRPSGPQPDALTT